MKTSPTNKKILSPFLNHPLPAIKFRRKMAAGFLILLGSAKRIQSEELTCIFSSYHLPLFVS